MGPYRKPVRPEKEPEQKISFWEQHQPRCWFIPISVIFFIISCTAIKVESGQQKWKHELQQCRENNPTFDLAVAQCSLRTERTKPHCQSIAVDVLCDGYGVLYETPKNINSLGN